MRILIYRLGSLGDTVVALPALHLIRRTFPAAEITILTNTPISGKAAPLEHVLENSGLYDKTLHYPVGLRNPRVLLGLLRTIRNRKFDLVVHLTAPRGVLKALRDFLFFKICASRCIGLPWKDKLSTRGDTSPDLYQHESVRLLDRIRSIGNLDVQELRNWDLRLTAGESAAADDLLKAKGVTAPFIALSMGTKLEVNDWGLSKWKQLLARLSSAFPDVSVVALGSSDEYSRAEELLNEWKGIRANICGLTSPRVSAALLRRSMLFIGHDSGPMHLAAASGVPCVAIFSARNLPGQWYPSGNRHSVIYHSVPCRGCQLEVCVARQKVCIESITVDEVFNAVDRQLAARPAPVLCNENS